MGGVLTPHAMRHPHVSLDPQVCHGKPCIRGTRILVESLLDLLAQGHTFDDIIADAYPQLTHAQLADAIAFASDLVRSEEGEPLPALR